MATPRNRNPRNTRPVRKLKPGHGQLTVGTLNFLAVMLSNMTLRPVADDFLETAHNMAIARQELLAAMAEAGGAPTDLVALAEPE